MANIFSRKKAVEETVKPGVFILNSSKKRANGITEAFKSEVPQRKIRFPKDLGEEHPIDFAMMEKVYNTFGFSTGVIDKYVDYIISGGFFVETENEKAKTILEDFMRDVNFDSILREWIKEALVKGNGFLEIGGDKDKVEGLKVLNANYMYVDRDKKGKIKGYNQYTGTFNKFHKNQMIPFKEHQIAHLTFNKVSGAAYGLGILYPGLNTINNILQNEKDQQTLMNRKANAPLWARMGNRKEGVVPKPSDITAMAEHMEYMNNKQEWATAEDVDLKVIDFGNIGDKFTAVLEHNKDMLYYTFQVPKVLMGAGNINEGIAKVQLEAWTRNIKSKQGETEKVIEGKIFTRVLNSNKLDEHVEFEWGVPSAAEKEAKITKLKEILSLSQLTPTMRYETEKLLAIELDINEELLETPDDMQAIADKEREREENRPQPIVPGQNRQCATHVHTESYDIDYELKEWLGFNYGEYLTMILAAVEKDNFAFLHATNQVEVLAGKLTTEQITKLKTVLKTGFAEGQSINTISKNIATKVGVEDLFKLENGKLILDANKNPILQVGKDARVNMIARTESTRMAANGTLEHYKAGGVEKIAWVASFSDRTCPQCETLNGEVFQLNEGMGMIPAHAMCRCTWRAVVE